MKHVLLSSIGDIFKKSFLEGYASTELTISSIAVCLLIACVLGGYIYFIYRLLCRKAFYDKNLGMALIAVTVITAAVIITVQSNVVVSLGMVGALSIVRFRTAIKDPLDLIFLFWSISVGIICGAGLSIVAVALCALLSLLLWIFNGVPLVKAPVLLLVSSHDPAGEKQILETVGPFCKALSVKSRSMTAEQIDLVIEIKTDRESELTAAVLKVPEVFSCSVVAHDGEVTF